MYVRKLIVLLLACLGGAALSAQSTKERAQPPAACDVLVYGATPGGVCAAIGAAREGASVVLLEPTEHIGGLSTGGLSHCDSNQMDRTTVMGLFDEWHRRIVADYAARGRPAPYDPTKKDQARWTFEPHVAMRVTRAMLSEAGVLDTYKALTVVLMNDRPIGRNRNDCCVDTARQANGHTASAGPWTPLWELLASPPTNRTSARTTSVT